MDLRDRVLRESDAGMQAAAGTVTYHVRTSWVRRLKHRRRETGDVEVDESYFGSVRTGQRGRGAAGKVPVFGL